MPSPFLQSVDDVLTEFDVSCESGLDNAEVAARRKRYGANRLDKSKRQPIWRVLLNQMRSVVVILLLVAALAAAALGRLVEALAIGAALLVNTLIGFTMEWRATRAMEALSRMSKTVARVRRNGKVSEIDAEQLVPGDILLFDAGDLVAADLRLLEANQLQCDEAPLTGESEPVDKNVDALQNEDAAVAERSNMAFKGTAVTQGSGVGLVVATGMDTELGRISTLVEEAQASVTPLQKRLDTLGARLAWLTVIVALTVTAAGLLAGKDLTVMVETAIALAIAAVPEGLPIVATLALAQGMRRMARRNAVIKQLAAVETLGAANLIFTDKTGTLTEHHMTLARLALARGTLDHDTEHKDFVLNGEPLAMEDAEDLRAALEICALCSNAESKAEEGQADATLGDPTEVALVEGAAAAGLERAELLERLPEVREESFDADTRMMATIHKQEQGFLVAVKGAPEAVLKVCVELLTAEGSEAFDAAARERWLKLSNEVASDGFRMLALARKSTDDENTPPYENLQLVGLAGLYDPPRAGIQDALDACRGAGIRVVMGTGDHARTACAIAREVGLTEGDITAVEAGDLGELTEHDEEERESLRQRQVFARISPEQKLQLIRLYQDDGWVVAMTGDGVNDAPALKKADIGIAMGKRGTEVAREAADMVLKDDAFATIVTAVEHGRTVFKNIRRFIVFLLSGNLGEIIAIAAAALVAAPLPMAPLQILYINFVCDVMPALALGLSPGEKGVMQQPPRSAQEAILERQHWIAIVAYGVIIAAAVLCAFAIALVILDMAVADAVTIGFLTFGFARLWHVFNMRSPGSGLIKNEVAKNGYMWVALGIGALLLFSAIWLPPLAAILSVQPLTQQGWMLIAGFSLLPLLVVYPIKRWSLWWEADNGSSRD